MSMGPSDQDLDEVGLNEIKLGKILLDMPAPLVSAQSWSIYDMHSQTFLFGKNEKDRREIASLSKIMTCYVVLKLVKRFNVDEFNTMVTVSENAEGISGTTADLALNDKFSVWELLHALMLPSGNDAAIALAEYFG
jgi:D-alanyl-D-alanine carboxypeptidase